MECGLTPAEFWDATWYELDLLSKQHLHRVEQQWDYTRHIMAALTGEKPSKIISLSFDAPNKGDVTTAEDARRIQEKYKR